VDSYSHGKTHKTPIGTINMATKQQKTANGNPNILNEDQEVMRAQVVDLELKARYWEAQWKIRYFTLEAEKIQPEYEEFLDAQRQKQEEALKRFQEQIAKMNEEAKQKSEQEKTLAQNKDFLEALSNVEPSPFVEREVNPLKSV
jgi:flagellar biosynthesis/type III secretory pathway protein FliH